MKIFLSYNSKDKYFVEHIASKLQNLHFEIFFDKESIESGDIWLKRIQHGLDFSQAGIIFLGENGVGEWQNKEILKILDLKLKDENYKIIPVIVPNEKDSSVNYILPWFLSDYQWIEFSSIQDDFAFNQLIETFKQLEFKNFEIRNPYKGLDSFDVEDSIFFFGRNYDTNKVFHHHLRLNYKIANNNFLAVVADSGVGKSSFVKASILAALKNNRFKNSSQWKQIIFKPNSSPLFELSTALKRENIINDSRNFEVNAIKYSDELLRVIKEQNERIVLYIDQFEEVITQCKDEFEKQIFLQLLTEAVKTEQLILLLSLRGDFYTKFTQYTSFNLLLTKNNYPLGEIENTKLEETKYKAVLEQIIKQPAKYVGVLVEQELVDTLINEIKKVSNPLPILQLTLNKLWTERKKDESKITLQDYAAVSHNENIAGIIEAHAESVFNKITRNEQKGDTVDLFRKIFIPNLIEISSSGNDTRKTATLSEFDTIDNFSKEDIQNIILELSSPNTRLIKIGKDEKVEVVHEVIINKWQRLKRWINERREDLLYRDRLLKDIKDYESKDGELFSGMRLKQAKNWQKKNTDLTTKKINEFIFISEKRKRKKWIITAILLSIITLYSYIGIINNIQNGKLATLKKNKEIWIQVEEAGGLDSLKKIELTIDNEFDEYTDLSLLTNLDTLIVNKNVDKSISFIDKVRNIKSFKLTKNINLSYAKQNEDIETLQKPNFTDLTDLSISYYDSISDFSFIKNQTKLTSFIFNYGNKNFDLLYLKKCINLKSLTVTLNRKNDTLRLPAFLCNIRKLEINLNNVNTIYWDGNFSNIENLTINNVETLSNFKITENLNHLKSLSLIGSLRYDYFTNKLNSFKRIEGLDSLSKLENLTLKNCEGLEIINFSPNLESLRSVFFEYESPWGPNIITNSNLKEINGISFLKKLDILCLKGCTNLEKLEFKSVMTNLKKLNINFGELDRNPISYENGPKLKAIEGLEFLINLKELELINCTRLEPIICKSTLKSITDLKVSNLSIKTFNNFQHFTSLKTLGLFSCYDLNKLNIDLNLGRLDNLIIETSIRQSIENFTQQSTLKSLKLSNCDLGNTNIPTVCRNLQKLSLSDINAINLIGFERLEYLSDLELENCQIENLIFSKKMDSLKTLTINNRAAYIKTIVGLPLLTNLNYLVIRNCDSLKSLDLSNCISLRKIELSRINFTCLTLNNNLKQIDSLLIFNCKNFDNSFFEKLNMESSKLILFYLPDYNFTEKTKASPRPLIEKCKKLKYLVLNNEDVITNYFSLLDKNPGLKIHRENFRFNYPGFSVPLINKMPKTINYTN